MSVVTTRRKTLYQLNTKLPQYKKKPTLFQLDLMKKISSFDHKQQPSRRRFQSTNIKSTQKQNKQTEHPVSRFILNNQSVTDQELKKFTSFLYKGVKYSLNLKEPSSGYIQKRKLSLLDVSFPGQEFQLDKKLLILDLDQTLIHSVGNIEESDVTLKVGKNSLKFNIRPYCYRFLQQMQKHYNVVVYTASTQNYAHPIIQYLNKPKKTIKAVLSRSHCLQTHNGFHIKDLRIIKQFELKDMLIVDNLVHSFAFQLDNGIPILEFLNNKKDRELYYLTEKLINIAKSQDIRHEIKKMYRLKDIVQLQESEVVWNCEAKY